MNTLRMIKTLLLIAAVVSMAAFLFTKNEVLRYVCFSILMLLFAINATEEYKKDKRRISFCLAILCYVLCLMQLVLLAGTLLGLE